MKSTSIGHIARVNGMSTSMIYIIIRKLERADVSPPAYPVPTP